MQHSYLLIGSSSGIGLALANTLLQLGHLVHAVSRTSGTLPEDVMFYPYDMCSNQPFPNLNGPFDGLVYLPGTINLKPIQQLSLKDFREDMEVNYFGAVKAVKETLPLMNEAGSSLVFVSTIAASVGFPYHASISGAKGALEGFAKAIAAELAPTVRCNVVAPSLTQTPLSSKLLDSEQKMNAASKRHPLMRIGKPADIANAIAFLLSDEASWITGQTLHIDGGLSTLRGL